MNKEHALHVDVNYSYKDRLRNWRKYSTRNKIPFDCKECNKTHAYKTVYLDTGEHVCWFCWIRKYHAFHNAVHKPREIVKVEKHKKKSQQVKEPIKVAKPKIIENGMDGEKYYDNIKHRFFTSYKFKNKFTKNNEEDK